MRRRWKVHCALPSHIEEFLNRLGQEAEDLKVEAFSSVVDEDGAIWLSVLVSYVGVPQ